MNPNGNNMRGISQSAAIVEINAQSVQVEVNTIEADELKFILIKLLNTAKESKDHDSRTPTTQTTIKLTPSTTVHSQ